MKVSRNQSESLSAYREWIAGLVEKVYPRFAAANKQCLIHDFFVRSLSTDCQKILRNANSTKIEDALNATLLSQSMYSSCKNCTKMQNKGENRKLYKTNYKCFVCGKAGHIAKTVIRRTSLEKLSWENSNQL